MKTTETLIDASKEVGIEVNAKKSEYMLLSVQQSARQNHNIVTYPFTAMKRPQITRCKQY
jgi:hypothetical protein